jgi:hypothetical protein
MVKVSTGTVRPDSLGVEFDDERLIANAGLVLVATLGRRLGIEQMVDKMVSLGERAGAARPGRKGAHPDPRDRRRRGLDR